MDSQFTCRDCKAVVVVPSNQVFTSVQKQNLQEQLCGDCGAKRYGTRVVKYL